MYVVFFFKQKTAYELRISDWSSDVCSSDLQGSTGTAAEGCADQAAIGPANLLADHVAASGAQGPADCRLGAAASVGADHAASSRSEERRVGKECVSTCSTRGSQDN